MTDTDPSKDKASDFASTPVTWGDLGKLAVCGAGMLIVLFVLAFISDHAKTKVRMDFLEKEVKRIDDDVWKLRMGQKP